MQYRFYQLLRNSCKITFLILLVLFINNAIDFGRVITTSDMDTDFNQIELLVVDLVPPVNSSNVYELNLTLINRGKRITIINALELISKVKSTAHAYPPSRDLNQISYPATQTVGISYNIGEQVVVTPNQSIDLLPSKVKRLNLSFTPNDDIVGVIESDLSINLIIGDNQISISPFELIHIEIDSRDI